MRESQVHGSCCCGSGSRSRVSESFQKGRRLVDERRSTVTLASLVTSYCRPAFVQLAHCMSSHC